MASGERLDLSKPRYDQSTFWGRALHFFETTDPRTILVSDQDLYKAKELVEAYRTGKEPTCTTDAEVWEAKRLYDSAFHPQTGDMLFLPGRMSFQVPGNMVITGCMMAFYKSNPAQIFWQFTNQSFNAIVNYTNRNTSSSVNNTSTLAMAFMTASTSACMVAVGLNQMIAASPSLSKGTMRRFVPLVACSAANAVNIPVMRRSEMTTGITVCTKDGVEVGKSPKAAVAAVSQVLPSRILMAAPYLVLTPVLMSSLESRGVLARFPFLYTPATVLVTGIILVFSTPLACAVFPQEASISIEKLEPSLQAKVRNLTPLPSELYYQKGL